MKRLILILVLLLSIPSISIAQSTASYGYLVSSLSTTSAGAVTGTSYALPQGYAAIVTWSVVADGSAISTTLEGSMDNSVWVTLDTITTPATGTLKNYGFTSVKFVRISQVSRTGGTTTSGSILTSRGYITSLGSGTSVSSSTFLAGDGSNGSPAYSFASEPTLGFWRSGAGMITNTGNLQLPSGKAYFIGSTWILDGAGNGNARFRDATAATGVTLKFDALPTIASGFGTSPSITAGSTPFAGSVNVGTAPGVSTGTINFNGTAFPSIPFCVISSSLVGTGNSVRVTTTTTQLTLNQTGGFFTASDIISWICVSSK